MIEQNPTFDKIYHTLNERAKELNCLYHVEEILAKLETDDLNILQEIIEAIPPGWQYPDICMVRLEIDGKIVASRCFWESPWVLKVAIQTDEATIGTLEVFYGEARPPADEGPFLREERRLINTIAERIGQSFFHLKLKLLFQQWEKAKTELSENHITEWQVILNLLLKTDANLYMIVSRKMMNHLFWSGIEEAKNYIHIFNAHIQSANQVLLGDENRPQTRQSLKKLIELNQNIFTIASRYLANQEILNLIQKWIGEDKSSFLIRILENPDSPLSEITDAIARFHHLALNEVELSPAALKGIHVSLIRRFFTDQLEYLNIAKSFVSIQDFYDLQKRIIHPPDSHGKLGGKSAGLFLALQILKSCDDSTAAFLQNLSAPKTWYITSDGLHHFVYYNNLEDVLEQKYKELDQIRQEYPHIIQLFKNSQFPPDLVKGLALALDDFGAKPLIVRSSSLLEDRLGAAFSGKYKSLFLANQGTREQRLEALADAIAEVYASTFGPDPILYRQQRGLLDFYEEMGVMIQEVVGNTFGPYYLPAYAGVAFSQNEFRWSSRIERKDGLIRLVPGLGTRAVDRLSDDYPILLAPGKPDLRVNISMEDQLRYTPKKIDVINLSTNQFETVSVREFLQKIGDASPCPELLFSIYDEEHIRPYSPWGNDIDPKKMVLNFSGLLEKTPFVRQIKAILERLQNTLEFPVDIEFVSDGRKLYLLQCRPQYASGDYGSAPIPQDIPQDDILFTAHRHISNGRVPLISHLVYIPPQAYQELTALEDLMEVGTVVGRLNALLPKRQFILIGPGRWGSRGDIRLGVNVTYADICNTAVLIEVARKKGNYVPDLSFGTHFFQDLAEAEIRYIPLYPDEADVVFNESFMLDSPNMLSALLPEYRHLEEVIHVIDIAQVKESKGLQILLNADLEQAVAYFTGKEVSLPRSVIATTVQPSVSDASWRWRSSMAQRVIDELDFQRFGILAVFLMGSVKNATAGPASDIDLLVHLSASESQKEALLNWFEGWSLCLSEINYLKTGYKTSGLLDVHLITDLDIEQGDSFAAKIGAVTDAARLIKAVVGYSDKR